MDYPTLTDPGSRREMTDVFLGYNHNLRAGSGEFYDMTNMTSDHYPILAPRRRRGIFASPASVQGLIAKDGLCWVDGADFVMGEQRIPLGLSTDPVDCPKRLVSMGAWVLILPDKVYINTADPTDFGSLEAEVRITGTVTFSPCAADGTARTPQYLQATAPEDPQNNDLWVDTSASPHALKQWSQSAGMWLSVSTAYLKIAAPGIGAPFSRYDGIRLSGLPEQLASLEGAAVVWDRQEDCLVVAGLLEEALTLEADFTVSRKLPAMDFVVESGNRLWGCRYGEDENGQFVNRLYASKLGDFKNWSCFMGLSTDSYYVNLGTDGPFTGAVSYLGYPLFFKEGCLHKVCGDYPAQFQVLDTPCRGVQPGCGGSLAMVNEVLFYKARHGVCAYDGSLPVEVSAPLGEGAWDSAWAGALGNKYYISMRDARQGTWSLFVYDTARRLWHREDDLRGESFCPCRGELYVIDRDSGKILALLGSGEPEKDSVPWMVQTGILGTDQPDRKYISRLTVRMSMDVGGRARFFVQYDSLGGWEHLGTVNVTSLKSFSLPIRPRRCDHLRLRIEGVGEARIYSITKTIEGGSEQ